MSQRDLSPAHPEPVEGRPVRGEKAGKQRTSCYVT